MPRELTSVPFSVTQDSIRTYAEITGDYNPLHLDEEFAAKTPMKGVIAHGTMSLSLIWQSLTATFGIEHLKDLSVTIQFDGKEFGPFNARGSRRNPGTYQTRHIFTTPGEGEVTLSFKKAASDEVLTLTLPFAVHSRKSIEIP